MKNLIECHTSEISRFVDHHLQRVVKQIPSCTKNTNFFFLLIHIHMYSLNNYINTYKKGIKSIKSGTQKQSLDIKLFGISRKQKKVRKKKQKGDVSSKRIESFTIVVVMTCRD